MRPIALALALMTLSLPAIAADAPADANETVRSADPAIGKQLETLGYKYTVDEDGDYKLTFELEKGRTQLAYVLSAVEKFGELQVREVWAPAYRSPSPQFPADVANRLLEESQSAKLGGWVKQGDMAVFVVKLAADASASQLDDAIDFVLRSADQVEAELTGKDEF
ncbi:YbjN domain-containing protein [Lysobacter sp.]|uniref:YbjN domain-containing protein n=1 Tax=Lysobacter sp. TaxID=72226 RepID=UPI002D5A6540|nr:YbjN domain-containing protein [Lysobacter sp.]HZX77666.1 YbjN domain-containing protein [Lysobacter sp.]